MRLLIYGGNSYSERRRIGDWPSIPPGALGDIYGLDSDVPAYGLGVLDESPFLVYRRSQDVAGQRLYAITLLLDPGREVWERFEWNAAALVCAMFADAGSLGNRLLAEPEGVDEEALGGELKRLPAPQPARADARHSFRALWAGSAPAGEFVAAPCEELGFASRPAPAEVAAQLAALPPCFRTAGGWLIGGSKGHAQAFGANLLVDLRAEAGAAPFSVRVEEGEAILDAWDCVATSPEHESALCDLGRTPVREWKEVEGFEGRDPRQVLQGLKLLAEAIRAGRGSAPSEKLLGALTKYADGGGPFRKEIYSALRSLVLSPEVARSPDGTRFILRDYFEHGQAIPPHRAQLLHPDTVAAEFLERELSPKALSGRIDLPPTTRMKVWQLFTLKEPTLEGCVARLREAVENLSDPRPEDWPAQANQLVEYVFRSRGVEGELVRWLPLIEDSPVREHLESLLCEEARARVKARRGNWRGEYRFTDDEDGSFLASLNFPAAEIQTLVRDTIANTGPGQHDPNAQWLDRIASSPLRGQLSLETKREIIILEDEGRKNKAASAWKDFRAVWEWYHGAGETPDKPITDDRQRRPMLMAELTEMARQRPNTKPALSAIVKALGELPEETVAALKLLRPPLDFRSAERWIKGWHDLGDHEYAASEARRLLTECGNALPKGFTLGQYDLKNETQITPLFGKLLFGGFDKMDGLYRTRLRELLDSDQHPELLRRSLRRAVDEAAASSAETGDFARRFVGERELLDLLFQSLTPEQSVRLMKSIAGGQPSVFNADAYNFLSWLSSDTRGDGGGTINYGKAFCRFLLSREGGGVKEHLAAEVSKGGPRVDVNRVLRTYLKENGDDEGEVGTPKTRPQSVVYNEKTVAKENAVAKKGRARAGAKNERAEAVVTNESAEAAPPPPPDGPRSGLIDSGKKKVKSLYRRWNAWLGDSKDAPPPGDEAGEENAAAADEERDGHSGAAVT